MHSPPIALFVGLAAWDTIALVPSFPAADSRVIAEDVIEAGGGPAATAAVACARLGVRSAFVGAIGDDQRGERILESLAAEGVDVEGAIICPGIPSTAAVIVADRAHGTRALCPMRPLPLDLEARHEAAIAAARMVHVDQAGYGPVAAVLARGNLRVPLSVDAGNPIPGLDPALTTIFAPTLIQLRNMFGAGEPRGLLARAGAPGWAVATDGGDGAYALDKQEMWHAPAHVVAPCVSTLGAGDVFHGALVAAWIRGFDMVRATSYAVIAAGLSCGGVDGRSAIPDHDTVMSVLADYRAARVHPMEV